MAVADLTAKLQKTMMRIRSDHPFFGTLGLFARFYIEDSIETAATDGKDIWFNPAYIQFLKFETLAGLIVHELLHAALGHCIRRKERDALLWNIAADIVVNGMVEQGTKYHLPEGAVQDAPLALLSVEEVYEQLQKPETQVPTLKLIDLREIAQDSPEGEKKKREIGKYWELAVPQASAIAQKIDHGFGHQGIGHVRDITELIDPTLDWRELLWEYVVSTPTDYSGFDRRFVGKGLYLDHIVGEKVAVAVAIDTSHSISQAQLTEFISEIQGMLAAYPFMEGILYYADADLYGPYEFSNIDTIPKPVGGGGTSFKPFLRTMEEHHQRDHLVCLYFTDGYGEFPDSAPDINLIWVIQTGGLPSTGIPFGEVVRIGSPGGD